MTSTAIFIPARFKSSRFPGKPLTDLGGIPMIKRVYEACVKTGYDTYVLTDDWSIAKLFNDNNCRVENADYKNGTERCSGAIPLVKKYDRFINVQGDMPDVTSDCIEGCIDLLGFYHVSTVYTQMPKELQNDPNTVKLIRHENRALWFGRGFKGYGDWHLGVYGYTREILAKYWSYVKYPEEQIEQLEQLRWIKNGVQIGVNEIEWSGIEINTPEDARKWNGRASNSN
jgi:3-deoxy-manno-octulosonate cytidylyltransferase (CMP-KDO synthetase)